MEKFLQALLNGSLKDESHRQKHSDIIALMKRLDLLDHRQP